MKLKRKTKEFMIKRKRQLKREGLSEARIESWRKGFLNEGFNKGEKK
jgi:hypothetical protein